MTDLYQEKALDWDINDMVRGISTGIGAAIQDNVALEASMHVMDFGAGTGLITAHVADKVSRVTAVDVSQAMLEQLKAKTALTGKVDILCRNILEEPLGEAFDLIVSAMAMHHVEDTDALIQRFAEHLKPGAGVALADLDTEDGSFHPDDAQGVYHAGFDRGTFAKLLEKHGLRNVRFVTAHTVHKDEKQYPIFLALATRG